VSALRKVRLGLWAAALAALGLWLWLTLDRAPIQSAGEPTTTITQKGAIGGPFTLTDDEGKPFSSTSLAGKPHVIFFGFTHCPDICPTAMMTLAGLMQEVQAPPDFKVLFVTVDPQRDTPELLKLYTDSFDPRIIGLTGTEDEIAKVAKLYRAFYRKVPTGGSYTMDHTAVIYLMDAKGELAGTLAHGEPEKTAAAKLRRLLGKPAT
jgi:protein SCO1/2